MVRAKNLLHANSITLPPFGYWTLEDWLTKGHECDEIRDCMLGWDLTDFGSGDFDTIGLTIFTLRNGHHTLRPYTNKTYCEKLLISEENQVTPMHYHVLKQEDIINRAGGTIVIELHNRSGNDGLADTDVTVSLDGVKQTVPAGTQLMLTPGESITIPPFLYHRFWATEGSGPVILGEVSRVNDDLSDNYFLKKSGRFPEIDEDCSPIHYLCNEYPTAG